MFEYLIRTSPSGQSRRLQLEVELAPGDVIQLRDRYWIVESTSGEAPVTLSVAPARLRLVLLHPDGHEELGAVRRWGREAPQEGHVLTTGAPGREESWRVQRRRLARDESGAPLIELIAERDYEDSDGERAEHELEHRLARADERPEAASALFRRVEREGLMLELVARDEGEPADWAAAEEYIRDLIIEEVGEDVLELAGVDTDNEPRERWLALVQERLLADLASLRDDVEGERDEIEVWEEDGRLVLASVGRWDDEYAPDKGHGWMTRLVDSGVLIAAGFARVPRAQL
jgi:hypothetical protein